MKRAYWPRDRLRKHQNKRLKRIIRYAYNYVPFYHRKFREQGIKPGEIKTGSDLNKLPVLRKDEIRKNIDQMISREYDIAQLTMTRTSGSTGKPLYFYINGSEDESRKARHLRANISCGQKPRDRWVIICTPLHFGMATRLQRLLGIYVPTPVSVFNDVATQFSMMKELEPDILGGYSNSILLLAKEAEKRETEALKPRLIIGGAEILENSSRQLVEKVFDAPFYDQYGCDEMGRISWQCKEKNEYHIDADSIIVQFVDDEGEVSSGERGEIVCTSLSNYAMPFIRYAVGDVGVQSNEEDHCPCGRTLPLMKVVEGRTDSFVFFPDGRVLPPMALNAVGETFKFHNHIDQYRIIQRRIDHVEFLIKMGSDVVDERTVEKELLKHIERTLEVSADKVEFEVKFVEDFPLDKTGKLRKVISELAQTTVNS